MALAGIVVAAIGCAFIWYGGQLAWLGGSPFFLLFGLVQLASGALLVMGRPSGLWLQAAIFAVTAIWALVDTGGDRWGLLARLGAPAVMLCVLTFIVALGSSRRRALLGAGAAQVLILAGCWWALQDHAPAGTDSPAYAALAGRTDWPTYGGDWRSDRFSPLAQITPENAAGLQPAWTYRIGGIDDLGRNSRFTATPLAVGDLLYLCSPRNVVVAIDSLTGEERWRHDPQVDSSRAFSIVCRGVSYHQGAGAGPCAARILEGTLDGRLIALDAATGTRCPGFGTDGAVDLTRGVQADFNGYYYVTSPPTIIGDLAVIGGYVVDNQSVRMPRSVVRAFDVTTGELRWVWDAGARADAPNPDGLYSEGNPNAWTVFSADPALGLVYVPTGNSSPDFFGGLRTEAAERYGTALVALDAATGQPRWTFQAIHHDIWDYDLPAQPALLDMPGLAPALILPSKSGDIFLLDRRSGQPLSPVEEQPVPQTTIEGERTSPTQPTSTGMPSFAPPDVTEQAMWGATPLDMLMCRLNFRRLHYQGRYTPPSTQPFLISPGTMGALNWGSVAIDRARNLMVVNSSNMPFVGRLVPRAEADARGAAPIDLRRPPRMPPPPMAMEGTPYGLELRPLLSPIGFPCLAPPWGEIAAVDLTTRQTVWRQPFGSTAGLAPFGIDLPTGIFNIGGAVATAGGVTFIGATTDGRFRAFETATGRELWRSQLPAGGTATPMTYVARDGRQMVAIVAGGHGSLFTRRGDYLVAYALPSDAMRRAQ